MAEQPQEKTAVNSGSYFEPIAEDEEENEETNDQYFDRITAEAYEAMDQLRDAEDEIEYLEKYKSWTDDWETAQAMNLRNSRSEFEQQCDERGKVGKLMSGRGQVVKPLSTTEEVVKPLSTTEEDDLISKHKNEEFARGYELRQDEAIRAAHAATCAAHAAIAGKTSFRTLSGPKDPNPEATRDLDF